MPTDIVTLDDRAIRRLERQFRDLGETGLGTALTGALSDVALDANRRLAVGFNREIAGGPERFTQIRPGQRSSSFVERPARFQSGAPDVLAALAVSPLQSTYLKYVLGERQERKFGDAGLADKVLFVPIEANLSRFQGINLKNGNLPRVALKKILNRKAASERPAAPVPPDR